MSGNVIIPRHYLSKLELLETEVAIKAAKDTFEAQLSAALGLTRVSRSEERRVGKECAA